MKFLAICLHNLRKTVYKSELHQLLINIFKDEDANIDLPRMIYTNSLYS